MQPTRSVCCPSTAAFSLIQSLLILVLNIAQVSLSTSGWCVCLPVIKSYSNTSHCWCISPLKRSSCRLNQITWLRISYPRGWKMREKKKEKETRDWIFERHFETKLGFCGWKGRQGRIIREGEEINGCDSYSQGHLSFASRPDMNE